MGVLNRKIKRDAPLAPEYHISYPLIPPIISNRIRFESGAYASACSGSMQYNLRFAHPTFYIFSVRGCKCFYDYLIKIFYSFSYFIYLFIYTVYLFSWSPKMKGMGQKKWFSSVCPAVRICVRPWVRRTFLSTTENTLCIGSFWNFAGFLVMIWKCACGFKLLIRSF